MICFRTISHNSRGALLFQLTTIGFKRYAYFEGITQRLCQIEIDLKVPKTIIPKKKEHNTVEPRIYVPGFYVLFDLMYVLEIPGEAP
jgi:hypothetical protein